MLSAKDQIVVAMVAGIMAKGICKMVAILTVKDYTDYTLEHVVEITKGL